MSRKYGRSLVIGESIMGMPYPVCFDPHYPITLNKPPVTLITGSPGSGKTFFGLTLAAHASILNKMTFILDPKGDFTVLQKLNLSKEINNVGVWSVIDPESGTVRDENAGILDPVLLFDNQADNVALTLDVIKVLTGGVSPKQSNSLIPLIQDVVKSSNPSMATVVTSLKSARDDDIRALGFGLETSLDIEIAKLLQANKRSERRPIDLDRGTLVASLMGLSLPPDSKLQDNYSIPEKVSVVIMWLLTSLVFDLMKKKPKSIYKTLIIDEAWSVMSNSAGRDMIGQVALLGRSLNMATILLTQSPSHIEVDEGPDLDTTISTRFAFRNNNADDNKSTRVAMRLPNTGIENLIPTLSTGSCLLQDCQGNYGFLHIMVPNHWIDVFNTNPHAELKKKR